ncbi:MAG: YHYH protein [Saprospiraceae bacterium]|nr:YHYH protein [Saprospiraceae bacterium]
MLKKNALTTLLAVAFVATAYCHDPATSHAPLREWHLKDSPQLHASFLLLKNDTVLLEAENQTVVKAPLADFSKEDQAFVLGKTAKIERLNQGGGARLLNLESFVNVGALLALVALAGFLFLKKCQKWSLAVGSAALLLAFKPTILGTDPLFVDSAFQPFKEHLATHWDDTWFYVESNGIPTTHSMMTGIVKWQQQVPLPQCYTGSNAWQIPLNPVLADTPVPVNSEHFLRGAVALAANGVPIFNPHTNTGVDALVDGQLDQWGGHSGRADDYHYHIAPLFLDTQTVDILPIAFALDGFAVYAGLEPDGSPMLPLDENHGHFDAAGTYHYHGTPEAPYMIGRMVGKVTEDADLQIIPQSKAQPVRPSLTPLSGAIITDFQPNGTGNGYILTYTRNGQTYQVDYSWTPVGVYTYNFISPSGTTTEVYNGHLPCEVMTAADEAGQPAVEVVLYPNPSSGRISLKVNGLIASEVKGVAVFDLQGKLVATSQQVEALHNLAKGVYLVKIIFEKGEISRKIIVQ